MKQPSLWHDIIAGAVSGLVAGALLLLFASQLDKELSGEQQRLENLRFVRDVSTAQEGAMPFQSLDLRGMDLSGLRFRCRDNPPQGPCLLRADFTGANLSGAIMRDMDLSDAVFTGANLKGTDFQGSRLDRADFTDANNLDVEKLEGACYDSAFWPPEVADQMPASAEGEQGDTEGTEGDQDNHESPVCTLGYDAS
jgi:hypothetical protein